MDQPNITATIASLYRYPVKGLSPEALDEAHMEEGRCFPGDRLFAVENGPSGFNPDQPEHQPKTKYLVLARNFGLARLHSLYHDESGELTIEGAEESLRASLASEEGRRAVETFLERYVGTEMRGPAKVLRAPGYHFMDSKRGFVSLINLASVRALEEHVGRPVDPLRFRGNIYVDGLAPWQEFDFVDRTLRIGAAEFVGEKRIDRCIATHVDPDTGKADIDMVRLLKTTYGHIECGVYLRIAGSGRIALGDRVTVADQAATA